LREVPNQESYPNRFIQLARQCLDRQLLNMPGAVEERAELACLA
jgi:hypothetical protein